MAARPESAAIGAGWIGREGEREEREEREESGGTAMTARRGKMLVHMVKSGSSEKASAPVVRAGWELPPPN